MDSNHRSREGGHRRLGRLIYCGREFPTCRLSRLSGAEVFRRNSGRIGSFEEGELEGDSARKEVAAQIRVRGADAVQLRAQEIDEAAKIRIVVQRDPLGVHEVVRQRLRRAGGLVEIEPLGHNEDRKGGGIAVRFRRLVLRSKHMIHHRLERYRMRLRLGSGESSDCI